MLDYLIKGGTVVDGTGAPGVRADVGVRDGRIVAVGEVDEAADRDDRRRPAWSSRPASSTRTPTTTPSSSGTRRRRPSNLHGVTSIDRRQLRLHPGARSTPTTPTTCGDMMARVEGMPMAALENGVALGLGHLRRLPRPPRRQPRRERRLPGRPLRAAPPGHGRRRGRRGGHRRAARPDARAARTSRSRPAASASRPSQSLHPLRRRRRTRSRRAGPRPTSCSRCATSRPRAPGHDARVGHRRLPQRLQRRRDRPHDRA